MRHYKVNDLITQKAADSAAAGSAFLAGTAWVADIEPVITLIAGIVAIIAGGAATWYHFERARYMHKKNKEDE
jgi:hypothetical protein